MTTPAGDRTLLALDDLAAEALRYPAAHSVTQTAPEPAPEVAPEDLSKNADQPEPERAPEPAPTPTHDPNDIPQRETATGLAAEQEPQMSAPTTTNGSQANAAPVEPAATAPAAADGGGETFRTFHIVIAVLGEPTSDRRILTNGIDLKFRQPPLGLQWQRQQNPGHSTSSTVGVIEDVHRVDNRIEGTGYLLNTPDADEAANLARHGVTGPSADIADDEWHFSNETGEPLSEEDLIETLMSGNRPYTAFTKGELISSTLVAMPAFGSTKITVNDERQPRDLALVAATVEQFRPKVYRHELFEDPKLTGPTHFTMTDDGRFVGHMAIFGQCHRGFTMMSPDDCVLIPHSPSNYAHFHTSPPVRLDNGERIPVGRLTVGTGHADRWLRPIPAAAHYDNTGHCFALVRAGEDKFGIWVSGVAAPGASPEIIEQGLAAPLSGDWRNFGDGLDLIAALSVNTPASAVLGADDNEGIPTTLVASAGPWIDNARRGPLVTRADIRRWIVEAFAELRVPLLTNGHQTMAVEDFGEQTLTVGDDQPDGDESDSQADSTAPITEVSDQGEQADDDGRSPNELIQEMLEKAGQ